MNNKGQTLVLFILLLPVLLLVLGFLIDIGYLYMEKRKVDHAVDMALEYGIEHLDSSYVEEKMNQLLILNLKTVDEQDIQIEENQITITISKTVHRIFPFLFKESNNTIYVQKTKRKNLEE